MAQVSKQRVSRDVLQSVLDGMEGAVAIETMQGVLKKLNGSNDISLEHFVTGLCEAGRDKARNWKEGMNSDAVREIVGQVIEQANLSVPDLDQMVKSAVAYSGPYKSTDSGRGM